MALRIPPSGPAASASELRRFLYDAYVDTPKPFRLLGAIRPYVCPFDKLLRFVPERASVLDCGCGPGSLLLAMAAVSGIASGTGCDIAAPPLASARAAAQRLGAEDVLTFVQIRSVHDTPPGPFDVVTMVDVLHHVPGDERAAIVAAAASRVRPGGAFIYKDMTTRSRWRRFAHNVDDWVFTREWVTQVADGAVEQWAAAAGLVLEHAEYIPRLVYGNELRVFRRPGGTA